nr:MAG TPA: hyaluronidase [Caudoviricetes sp.]
MPDKVLNTRIALRYDTYENWMSSTVILKKGEVAIATIPTGDTSGSSQHLPAVLMKVGDGDHTFKDLKWTQAVAADVPTWAKQANKPTYAATEITGLADYISGEIQDTDTQYNLVKGANDYEWKLMSRAKGEETYTNLVATLTIPDKTADITALQTLVGDTKVSTQIANAIAALKLDETYEAKGAADTVKAALLGDAATDYNTLGKLEDAVLAVKATAESKTTMAEVEAKDYATKTEAQGYATAVVGTTSDTDASDTVKGAKKYADKLDTAMGTRVEALETAIGAGGSVGTQIDEKINLLDMEEVAVGAGEIIEKISQIDGKVTASKRKLAAADIPELAISKITDLQTTLDGKQATIAWQSDNYDAATNKAITKSDLDAAVAGLSGAVHFIGVKEALPETGNNGDIVIVGNKEYVYSTTDKKWHELGDETIYAVKGEIVDANIKADAAIAQSKIAGLTEALAEKAKAADLGTMAGEEKTDYVSKAEATGYDDILTTTVAGTTYETKTDATAKLTEAKGYTDAEIKKLNADAVTAGEGEIISEVSEAAGKVTAVKRALVAADIPTLAIAKVDGLQAALDAKANDADLAAIAKTGSTDDLVQGTKTLIFDCGDSTGN